MKKTEAKKIVDIFLKNSGSNLWVEFLEGSSDIALVTNYWAVKFKLSDVSQILDALAGKGYIFNETLATCYKIENKELKLITESLWENVCKISRQEQERDRELCIVQRTNLIYEHNGNVRICYAKGENENQFPIFLNNSYFEIMENLDRVVPYSAGEIRPIILSEKGTQEFVGLIMPIRESGIRSTIQNLAAFM